MADAKQGLMSFPGIKTILRGDFTLSHGISPSVATVVINPQGNFAVETGPLVITYGTTQIRFEDCVLDLANLESGLDGRTWNLRILDRRWKWEFGHISGKYNVIRSDGRINKVTEKSPKELATLLLKAMGETGFDVSGLPDTTRPLVNWDYANPAQELASLCDLLGARVVLGLDNKVRICELGKGVKLPSDRYSSGGYGFNPPQMPDKLLFVCGPTRYQLKLILEAVGRDTDGSIKLIKDLSYNPRGVGEDYGWCDQDPSAFQSLIGSDDGQEKTRALALETVYKWYRIKDTATLDMKVPEYKEKLENISQLLPLDDRLIDQETAVGEEYPHAQHAFVEGRFYDNVGDPKTLVNTAAGTRFRGSFTIDRERGIVMFSEPVYLMAQLEADLLTNDSLTTIASENSFVILPAQLTLDCVVTVADKKTRQPERHTVEKKLTNNKFRTKEKPLRRDDVFLIRKVEYTALSTASYGINDLLTFTDAIAGPTARVVDQVVDNKLAALNGLEDKGIDARIKYYLETEAARLTPKESLNYSYPYIRKISPDGLIQQVSWSVGSGGATTSASENNEFDLAVPSYEERRNREFVKIERKNQTFNREESETF